MRRLRVLRVLLPATILLFVALVVIALNLPEPVHRESGQQGEVSRRAEKIRYIHFEGDEAQLDVVAEVVEELGEGRFHLEDVSRFVLFRPDREPLEVSAEVGDYEGAAGERVFRFQGEVEIRDPETELVLTLPGLVVDEAGGEARSTGAVTISGDRLGGNGASLVYGLQGQPTELAEPVLARPDGAVLTARRAVLLDDLDDVEFRTDVEVDRGEEQFRADRLRLIRNPEGRLRRFEASGGPANARLRLGESMAGLRATEITGQWDESGSPEDFRLEGDAALHRGAESLSAVSIHGRRGGSSPWEVQAVGTVFVRGVFAREPAWLRAERLDAMFDEAFELENVRAGGQVRFEGPDTRAEADLATYRPGENGGEIRLQAVERPKARLARAQIRVAAERIVTDPRGGNLVAENDVEATLLPGGGTADATPVPGMFRVEEAVHFVSDRLEGGDDGSQLLFRGGVRGWQGERNLSAETVRMNQQEKTLSAIDEVTTRIPRESGQPVLTEDQYVQISADRLDYAEGDLQATYTGEVRVRLAEGWIEAERMEVDLKEVGGGIREVRCFGKVRIEFRDPSAGEAPRMMSGSADRVVYLPLEQTVRLFGDDAPAAVRNLGERGGTTTGRVLRYRLDLGTLEVDAGGQGTGKIKTGGE